MYEPLPLFDCVFCVKDSREVVMGLLRHSLRQKYFDHFLEQSNNDQVPLRLEAGPMSRYDADAVQAWFDKAGAQVASNSSSIESGAFLRASFTLCAMMTVPAKQRIERAKVDFVQT